MGIPGVRRSTDENDIDSPAGMSKQTIWLLIASAIMLTIAIALIVVVVVTLLRGAGAATSTAELRPSLTISPTTGVHGTLLMVSGEGWQSGEAIAISLVPALGGVDASALQSAGARADSQGGWQVQFPLLLDESWPAGTVVSVIARGQSSGRVALTEVTVAASTATPPSMTVIPPVGYTPTRPGSAPTETTIALSPTATPEPPTPTPIVVTPAATQTASPLPTATTPPTHDVSRWRGEYFANAYLVGSPVLVRDDAYVDFDWGAGAPAANLPADAFSVRWSHTLYFNAGTYRFQVDVDDGVRVRVDGAYVIDAWQVGSQRSLQGDYTLAAGYHTIVVEYFEEAGRAAISLSWTPAPAYPDWKGEYYGTGDLAGAPLVTRNDPVVDFDWGFLAPAAGVPADSFSARWTRSIWFDEGAYRFNTQVDDGVRLWVDGYPVIDQWRDGSAALFSGHRYLDAGEHELRIEYYDRTGKALMRFWWDRLVTFPEWRGEYYANASIIWPPALVRNDSKIDFDWSGAPPAPALPQSEFSVRWTGWIDFGSDRVRFRLGSDDGIRLWVDNRLAADRWYNQPYGEFTVDWEVTPGYHEVRVEYYQWLGGARVLFDWEPLAAATTTATAPSTTTETATPSPITSATATVTKQPTATPTSTPLIPPTSTATPITWTTVTPQPAGNRLIRVSPVAAVAGSTVTLSGENWPAGASVRLGFATPDEDPARVALLHEAMPADDGTFKVRLAVDETWADETGLLVIARVEPRRVPEDLRTTWLAIGKELTTDDYGLPAGAPPVEKPRVRVYASASEWQAAYVDRPSGEALARSRQLMLLLKRFGIGDAPGTDDTVIDEPGVDTTGINWKKSVVAEVCLGAMPTNSVSVDIIGAAKTQSGVQIIVEVAPLRELLSQIDRHSETAKDTPCAAALIPRSDLPRGAVAFRFVTTGGQWLPPFRATL